MQALSKFLIIFLAVTLGTFAADRLSDVFHYYQLKVATDQIRQETEQAAIAAQEQRQLRKEANHQKLLRQAQADQEARRKSKKGRELNRSCLDWKRMHEQTPTNTSQRESNRACAKYDNYIYSGR